jgi:hypothetical protein
LQEWAACFHPNTAPIHLPPSSTSIRVMILAEYIFLSNQSRSKPQEGCSKFLALHPGFRVLVQGQLNLCATMVMMMMMPHNFCTSITE